MKFGSNKSPEDRFSKFFMTSFFFVLCCCVLLSVCSRAFRDFSNPNKIIVQSCCGILYDTLVVHSLKKHTGVEKGVIINGKCHLCCRLPYTDSRKNIDSYFFLNKDFLAIGDTLIFSEPRVFYDMGRGYKTVDSVIVKGNTLDSTKEYYSLHYFTYPSVKSSDYQVN